MPFTVINGYQVLVHNVQLLQRIWVFWVFDVPNVLQNRACPFTSGKNSKDIERTACLQSSRKSCQNFERTSNISMASMGSRSSSLSVVLGPCASRTAEAVNSLTDARRSDFFGARPGVPTACGSSAARARRGRG